MTDQQLQEQLISATLPTPAGVWERLNALLDEEANDTLLMKKLDKVEIEPPSFIWNAIEVELDEQQKEQRVTEELYNSQIPPPPFIWQQIESALDQEQDAIIAGKLESVELTPPSSAWNIIEENLQTKAKVIPINKQFAPVFRLAAAAVIVAALAWGAFQLFDQPQQQTTASNQSEQSSIPPAVDSNSKLPGTASSENKEEQTTSSLIASNEKQSVSNQKHSQNNLPHEKPVTRKQTAFKETNYLLVLNDKGDLIRVSKKLSTMDCVKNNQVPVDAVTALQAKDCEEKIKRLQERMATSLFGPVLDPVDISKASEK